MMKRFLTFLLAFCLMLCTFVVAQAEYLVVAWQNHLGQPGCVYLPDTRIALEGNGEESIVFFVRSRGNAWIELCQTKGTCSELSYVKMFSGWAGEAKEWGKYEISVSHAESGTVEIYQWNDTYYNGSIRLELPYSGNYYVYVRPYTKQEMTDSWWLDSFGDWREPPYWWIDSTSCCTVTNCNPFQ